MKTINNHMPQRDLKINDGGFLCGLKKTKKLLHSFFAAAFMHTFSVAYFLFSHFIMLLTLSPTHVLFFFFQQQLPFSQQQLDYLLATFLPTWHFHMCDNTLSMFLNPFLCNTWRTSFTANQSLHVCTSHNS
jgi:hypothetical protein